MMKIDELYRGYDKEEFYIGRISQVTLENCLIEIENLTLLQTKIINSQNLFPKTINYLVTINDERGIFLGKVIKSQVRNNSKTHDALLNEDSQYIVPELTIRVIGILKKKQFVLPNNKAVGLTDKVYIATSKIMKMYLNSFELMYNNKTESILEDIAKVRSFEEWLPFSVNINTLFDRHLLIVGATNSGKSTSALRIIEKAQERQKKFILIDPTGEYRDSFGNCNDVKSIDLVKDVTIDSGKVNLSQWKVLFQTNENTQGPELAQAIEELKFQHSKGEHKAYVKRDRDFSDVERELTDFEMDNDLSTIPFELALLEKQIIADSVKISSSRGEKQNKYVLDLFTRNANEWLIQRIKYIRRTTKINSIFSDSSSESLFKILDDFLKGNKSLYINVSTIGSFDAIGSFIIDIISEYLFEHKSDDQNAFFMYIDEVHRYLNNDEIPSVGLNSIAREGRKKGIFLFLTSQSPKDIPNAILNQIGSVIVHRLTTIDDIQALKNYLTRDTLVKISDLNKGEAILSSINLLENLFLKFNKSSLPHYNDTQKL